MRVWVGTCILHGSASVRVIFAVADVPVQRLVADVGYAIIDLRSSFGGQYRSIEARAPPWGGGVTGMPAKAMVGRCRLSPSWSTVSVYRAACGRRLGRGGDPCGRKWTARGDLRGSAATGGSDLTVVPNGRLVGCLIDINPRNHGGHVPQGTGQRWSVLIRPWSLARTSCCK